MIVVEHRITAPDGVTLYARDHAPQMSARMPVVCLPGLTRNAKDFEPVARRLSASRRVVCLDFRGRGQSGRADPSTYRPDQECADTLGVLDHLGIRRFGIIGTSRGGIVAMIMATRARERMAGVVFNDIGPRIDVAGLLRIRSYLGKDPQLQDWPMAVAALKATNPGLETLGEDEWLAFARRVFRGEDGRPRPDYDPGLLNNFPHEDDIRSGKVPELWGLLDLMAGLPAVVLRGEHSDLLSADTVAQMQAQLPGLEAVLVRNRGHVPFLDEPECEAAIDSWLAEIDRGG